MFLVEEAEQVVISQLIQVKAKIQIPIILGYHLAKRPGWVFTRSQIVNAVRGDDYPVTERAVDVQIVGLRRKMGGFGELIETVRGIGYRFTQEL